MNQVSKVPNLDALRLTLPAHAYLTMLSQVALTGTMPMLDIDGRPTSDAQPCSPQMRYDALKYLTDKIVPQAKAQDVNAPPDLEAIAAKSQVLRSMPLQDLIALRDAARKRIVSTDGKDNLA